MRNPSAGTDDLAELRAEVAAASAAAEKSRKNEAIKEWQGRLEAAAARGTKEAFN